MKSEVLLEIKVKGRTAEADGFPQTKAAHKYLYAKHPQAQITPNTS